MQIAGHENVKRHYSTYLNLKIFSLRLCPTETSVAQNILSDWEIQHYFETQNLRFKIK